MNGDREILQGLRNAGHRRDRGSTQRWLLFHAQPPFQHIPFLASIAIGIHVLGRRRGTLWCTQVDGSTQFVHAAAKRVLPYCPDRELGPSIVALYTIVPLPPPTCHISLTHAFGLANEKGFRNAFQHLCTLTEQSNSKTDSLPEEGTRNPPEPPSLLQCIGWTSKRTLEVQAGIID
jgi:hypothetical protein